MKFGSWTFSSSEVQMAFQYNQGMCDLSNYVFSGTWDLMGCPARIVRDSNKKYSEITYRIILRRKTLFFTVNLLTPCVLISFLSVLTFYLPANAQEKVTLCISILLALIVFLLLVSRSLPPTSVTIPLISKYLFFAFIMNIITIVTSVVIININYRSPRTYKMPRWMRVVFLNWLPIIMFMTRPKHGEKYLKWHTRKQAEKIANSAANNRSHRRLPQKAPMIDETKLHVSSSPEKLNKFPVGTNYQSGASSTGVETFQISVKALRATESVEYITEHLRMKDDYDAVSVAWLRNTLNLFRYALISVVCIHGNCGSNLLFFKNDLINKLFLVT